MAPKLKKGNGTGNSSQSTSSTAPLIPPPSQPFTRPPAATTGSLVTTSFRPLPSQPPQQSLHSSDLPSEPEWGDHTYSWAIAYAISLLPILASLAFHIYQRLPGDDEDDSGYLFVFMMMWGSFCHAMLKNPQEGRMIRCLMRTFLLEDLCSPPDKDDVWTVPRLYGRRVDFIKNKEPVWYGLRYAVPTFAVFFNALGQGILTGQSTYLLAMLAKDFWAEDAPAGMGLTLGIFKFVTELCVGGPSIFNGADKLIRGDIDWRAELLARLCAAAGTLGFVWKGYIATNEVFRTEAASNIGLNNDDIIFWTQTCIVIGMIFGGQGLPARRFYEKITAPILSNEPKDDPNPDISKGRMSLKRGKEWFMQAWEDNRTRFLLSIFVSMSGAFTTGFINGKAIRKFFADPDHNNLGITKQQWQAIAWAFGSVTNVVTQGRDYMNACIDTKTPFLSCWPAKCCPPPCCEEDPDIEANRRRVQYQTIVPGKNSSY